MNNFSYYNPTRILFGKGAIAKISRHIPPKDAKVLMLYGGGPSKELAFTNRLSKPWMASLCLNLLVLNPTLTMPH